jgi:large subunit ribosomal protein L10
MSKFVKELLKLEIEKNLGDVEDFVVVITKGLGGNDNNEMRGELKEKGIKLKVVKNSAMRQALDSLGKAAAVSLFLEGPRAVAYGGDSVVDVAKEMSECIKKYKVIEFSGAFVDGVAVDAAGTVVLSKMPSRVELQGEIVLLANSPGSNVAGAIAGPAGAIAGCIKSLVEKLEEAA